LQQATKDVCGYCGGNFPGWPPVEGPNAASNYVHVRDGKTVLCEASSIHSRLAFDVKFGEGGELWYLR